MDERKRASMREGPLADLFRRTDGEPPKRAPEPPPVVPEEPVVEVVLEPEARVLPTPQERLRAAFSPDIPENIFDRTPEPAEAAAPAPAPPAPAPVEVAAPPRAPVPVVAAPPAIDPYARPNAPPLPVPGSAGNPIIRVVGVGGAGVNAVNRMVEAQVAGVEFMAINTDLQSLQSSAADQTLHIGEEVTRGLGSGSDPELGRQAAMDDYDRIKAMLKGSDMVFITAGAGGGTGTGAAPITARIAREVGALTVGIITKPFDFEGTRRREQAERGVEGLAAEVDTLIVVPNNRLLSVLDRGTSMVEAFRVADDVLRQGVQGISDLVTLPGLINLDFADVRTIMSNAGPALLGIGMGTGEKRALEAAEKACSSPLLETSIDGARAILLSITAGPDLSLWEVNEAAQTVAEAAHPDANIIFGAMVDDALTDTVWVTVVATGYGDGHGRRGPKLQEPAGEPKVTRLAWRAPPPPRPPRRGITDFEVPEFIPRS